MKNWFFVIESSSWISCIKVIQVVWLYVNKGLKDGRSFRLKDFFSGVRELVHPWNSVREFILIWRDRITAV